MSKVTGTTNINATLVAKFVQLATLDGVKFNKQRTLPTALGLKHESFNPVCGPLYQMVRGRWVPAFVEKDKTTAWCDMSNAKHFSKLSTLPLEVL